MTLRTSLWCSILSASVIIAISFCVQVVNGFAQSTTNATKSPPVMLSLKENLTSPIDPRKIFPEISYKVAPDANVSTATWVFSIQKGIPTGILGHSLYPVLERKEEVQILLSNKAGTLTGKDGDMQKFLSMWITYGKIRGEGTMGVQLIDFKEWQEKEGQARKLSNVLEFPVRLSN